MGMEILLIVGAGAGALLTLITLIAFIAKPIRKLARQNDEFREDWYGVAARPGRAAIPGVPERLARIEKELNPNGGSTLRDKVDLLGQRLDDHLGSHSS
ncbi:hypothetical protein ACQPZK_07605 [Micromonospora sp. CA-249363]|uniref:hypothetical protein n=1 Tax=Micromonospora sp. CA-249363 TaxID=3239963 RepID=UPI003D8F5DB8